MVNTPYRRSSDWGIDFRTTRYLDKSYCNIITTYSFSVNVLSSKSSKKEIRASELTYEELTYEDSATPDNLLPTTAHFVGLPLHDTWHPIGKEEICQQICDGAVEKYKSKIKQKEYREVYSCRYQMAEHHSFFLDNKINNEQGIRYTFADPIVSMLRRAFGYKLEDTIQDTIEDTTKSMSSVSKRSKADYVCYILTKVERDKDIPVPLVILETKHLRKIDSGAIAQTLGYFCKGQGRKTSTKQGLAILLNGYNDNVQVKIFTFPYYNENTGEGYGIQSLVLPVYECSYGEFIDGKFLIFLLILCSPATDYLFRIKYQPIKPSETILVVSDTEFAVSTALRKQEKQHEEILAEKERQIAQYQQNLAEKERQYQQNLAALQSMLREQRQ